MAADIIISANANIYELSRKCVRQFVKASEESAGESDLSFTHRSQFTR